MNTRQPLPTPRLAAVTLSLMMTLSIFSGLVNLWTVDAPQGHAVMAQATDTTGADRRS